MYVTICYQADTDELEIPLGLGYVDTINDAGYMQTKEAQPPFFLITLLFDTSNLAVSKVVKFSCICEYYRVKINEALPMTPPITIPPVVIVPNDFRCLNRLLQRLIAELKPFSSRLAQSFIM